MKSTLVWTLAVPILAMVVPPSDAADRPSKAAAGLSVSEVVEAGRTKEFFNSDAVVLKAGFWAKAGADVTVRTALEFLQMSDSPHNPPPPRDPGDRSPPPPGDCPDYSYSPCISGHPHVEGSAEVDIGLNRRLPNPARYYAINGIEINEVGRNDPCWLRLWGNIVDPRFAQDEKLSRILAEYKLDKCKNLMTWIDHKIVAYERSTSRFIRGVQVCLDHQTRVHPLEVISPTGRLEIKGVRVLAGQVSSMNEHVQALTKPKEFMRPNCPDHGAAVNLVGAGSRAGWHTWSTCPDGQLATGVTVWYEKDRALSAMQVKCKYVRLLPGPAPVKDDQGY